MNDVTTINEIIRLFGNAKGLTPQFSETLVTEFFKSIESGLRESGDVTVKGLGRFCISDDGGVMFEAEDEVAKRVNEPFECFEPFEIDDEEEFVDDVDVDAPSEVNSIIIGEAVSVDDEPVDNIGGVDVETIDENTGEGLENDEMPLDEPVESPDEEPVDDSVEEHPESLSEESHETSLEESTEPEITHRHRLRYFILGVLTGIIIGFAAAYVVVPLLDNAKQESTATESVEIVIESVSDNDENVPDVEKTAGDKIISDDDEEAPVEHDSEQAPIVTETVSSTNYLATMARRHYGRFEFWVYIYEENASKLDDPDLIEPNTVVVIPPADKYGIDKNDKASISRAEQKAKEIYKRFGKK